MLYIAYPFAAFAALVFDLASKFLLNWLVVLAANNEGYLPAWLKWFQTFDASLDQGMLARRREVADGLGGDTWAAFNPYPQTTFDTYKNRALWLFRNSGYGFDYYLLGVAWNPAEWRVVRYVETDTLVLFVAVGRGFNVYAHGRYGMAKLGWKAWNLYNKQTGKLEGTWGDAGKIPITLSLSPFKRRG